jgi:GcrA cell cycle regulator
MTESPWNIVRDQRLETLWLEGHSMTKIGIAMGVTKNAVAGRVHRLHLPPRQSPIGFRNAKPKSPRRARIIPAPPSRTLPILPSIKSVVIPMTPPAPPLKSSFPHCQFIRSKGRPWIWCDKPAVVTVKGGRVASDAYCEACYARVYTSVKANIDMVPWLKPGRAA